MKYLLLLSLFIVSCSNGPSTEVIHNENKVGKCYKEGPYSVFKIHETVETKNNIYHKGTLIRKSEYLSIENSYKLYEYILEKYYMEINCKEYEEVYFKVNTEIRLTNLEKSNRRF